MLLVAQSVQDGASTTGGSVLEIVRLWPHLMRGVLVRDVLVQGVPLRDVLVQDVPALEGRSGQRTH